MMGPMKRSGITAVATFLVLLASPGSGGGSAEEQVNDDSATSLADQVEKLQALGYVEGDQPARDERGVTLHDPTRAFQGVNLYTSEHAPKVFLVDMEGRALHEWHVDWKDPEDP